MSGRSFFVPNSETIGSSPQIEALTLPMVRFNIPANSVAVVWHERELAPNSQYADVYYASFSAATKTWSGVTKLNQDGTGHDHFMPAVDCDNLGYVIVDWYDRRNSASNLLYELWSTIITPWGTFVQNNFQMTTWQTDPTNFKTYYPNKKFMGDYHQVFRLLGYASFQDSFVSNSGGYTNIFLGSESY